MLNATKKWLSLKLSSVIMVPFMIWFLFNFVSIYDSNYENIVDRIKLNSLPTKKSFINELKKIILV